MTAYKMKGKNTWAVHFRYKDWKGETKRKKKEGFKTKHEAMEYEKQFLQQIEKDMDMNFSQFLELYINDMRHHIRPHTWNAKMSMINKFVVPYFGNKSLNEITSLDIVNWQNSLCDITDSEGKKYAPTYLRTIQNQLHAIFNHAETYYLLKNNPCRRVKKMGTSRNKEMMFWTEEEYFKFRDAISEDPRYFYAFELLYWCGIREGELLALTMEDFDFNRKTLRISKSYQRIKGKDIITDPKTEKSNRTIALPDFLCDEMEDYFISLGNSNRKARIFENTKSHLHHLMDKYSVIAGVPRIRIHDIRHSCVAMMINRGISSFVIADRMGHENIHITETYAHLFPSLQRGAASMMDDVLNENTTSLLGGNINEAV